MKNISFLNIQDVHTSLQSRTSKAWDYLYIEALRKVKTILRAKNVEEEDIKNIFNDCMTKLWLLISEKKQDFSIQANDYYFGVVVNCSKKASINQYRRDEIFSEIAGMLRHEGEAITELDELWFQQLKEIILGDKNTVLTKKEIIVIRMRYEGYSYKEIAAELALENEDSAKNIKHLAVKKLRDFLKKFI